MIYEITIVMIIAIMACLLTYFLFLFFENQSNDKMGFSRGKFTFFLLHLYYLSLFQLPRTIYTYNLLLLLLLLFQWSYYIHDEDATNRLFHRYCGGGGIGGGISSCNKEFPLLNAITTKCLNNSNHSLLRIELWKFLNVSFSRNNKYQFDVIVEFAFFFLRFFFLR